MRWYTHKIPFNESSAMCHATPARKFYTLYLFYLSEKRTFLIFHFHFILSYKTKSIYDFGNDSKLFRKNSNFQNFSLVYLFLFN
jgi:hypothetical protein